MAIEDSMDREMNRDDYGKEVIQDVITIIETDSVTPQERAKMIKEFSDEEYLVDIKEKSRKVGIEEGIEKGIEKGIKKGMEKGIEKGEKKAKIEIAKNLLSAKVDINTIVISTGLSIEEIETIKSKGKSIKDCYL